MAFKRLRLLRILRWRTLLRISFFLLLLYFIPFQLTSVAENIPMARDDVLVIAHRGGAALWPENTLFAFEQAVNLGVDMLEMDIHSSADDALVVIHDSTVNRTTDGKGKVNALTLEQLQALDAGYAWTADDGESYLYRGRGLVIPTLEAVFAAFPAMPMRIDIRQTTPPIYEAFCELIHKYKMEERVIALSANAENLLAFRGVCPEVASSMSVPEMSLFALLNHNFLEQPYSPTAQTFDAPAYYGNIPLLTARMVQETHRQGKTVFAWTIDKPAQMRYMLELGVDGIITNYPDRLLELLGR